METLKNEFNDNKDNYEDRGQYQSNGKNRDSDKCEDKSKCEHKSKNEVVVKLMESIANEENGLGNIIYQEGEKIEKAICFSHCIEDLLKIDKSVQETLKEITKAELLLLQKLEETRELICKDCL